MEAPPAAPAAEAAAKPTAEAGSGRRRASAESRERSLARELAIARIAGAQRGRVTRAQLLAAGLGDSSISYRISVRRLHPKYRGVYAVGHDAPVPLGDETAALLACGDGAVLSHRAAGRLWGLLPPEQSDGRQIEITLPPGRSGGPSGIRIHRTRRLDEIDIRKLDGLLITSPARTLLDLAEELETRSLERAVDQGFVRRIVRERDIADVIRRFRGRRRARLLETLASRSEGPFRTRSEAEEAFLALIRSAALPAPEVNARLHGYEVDFLWRDHRLVVEVDGYRFHSTRGAFERDRAKGSSLAAAGVSVMRTTWRQLEDEPYVMVARVAQALAWREAEDAARSDAA
jgi:very-short-patch-repair endonuclease